MYIRCLLLPIILAFSNLWLPTACLLAQLPAVCAGTAPGIECATTCISCRFDDYKGATAGFPRGKAVEFCGTVENAQWLGFIAGTEKATFSIVPSACVNGDGLQVALYRDCQSAPLFCTRGERYGGTKTVSIEAALVVGATYYLLVDGYAGDDCDFTVRVSPKEAVYEPPLGTVGAITGPTELCAGATGTFSVLPVAGATAYVWSGPPGTKIDTLPLPAVVVGGTMVRITMGEVGGNICVQAANACRRNAPCTASLPIAILPPSARPTLLTERIQHLNCNNDPTALVANTRLSGTYAFYWTAVDSSAQILSGANTPSPRVRTTGRYAVQVTDPTNGCVTHDTIQVRPPDSLRTAAFRLKRVSCFEAGDGELAVLSVTGGKRPYTYALGEAVAQPDSLFKSLSGGRYTVRIQSVTGCVLDTIVTIQEPGPLLLELGQDTTLKLGDQLALWRASFANRGPSGIRSLRFEPDSLVPQRCDTCLFAPVRTFRYRVTLVDSNGCVVTDARTVVVERTRRLYAPNVFAPENSEPFRLFYGPEVTRVRSLRIFDRWGGLVFQRENLLPNATDGHWDGSVNGRRSPPAIYVYRAEVEFLDGTVEVITGDVALVR